MTTAHSNHDLVPALVEWANARDSIRAMLLTSTRAIPGAYADTLSDYDVILIVQDIFPFVEEQSWLSGLGEVLVAYWDPVYPDPTYGDDCCGSVTQYVDGLKIDFTLWPITLLQKIAAASKLPQELDAGYQVLLDKDGLTATMRPSTGKAYLPRLPSFAAYQTHVNDFLTDAPYVAKCLWRGDLLPAKWALDYDMKHVYLLRMLEWWVGVNTDWSVPVGALGKGLKKRLPPELWTQVEQSFAGAGLEENWEALGRTMTLFRQVAVEVGAALGYEYPHALHKRVQEYVEYIRQLESPRSPLEGDAGPAG